jgi:dihydroxy-acid dehydratase
MNEPKNKPLRSEAWLNDITRPDQTAIYIERLLNYGITREELQAGRPIIGIAQTGSDLTPCNRHHLDLADRVRDGIRDAGGIPLEFPVHPIFENGKRPTAALDRNLAYLGLVEVLYGYPLDGVVLTTGCDKTAAAPVMAAAAVNLPAIVLSGGPMLNGWDGAQRVGSGSIIWSSREQLAAGQIDYEGFMDQVVRSAPSIGHCNTMGTALTMNSLLEALGLSLPGCAAIPAPYRERGQMAYNTGLRIVDMVKDDLRPTDILKRENFVNAIKVCTAIGGSTNAPVHIQAIANSAGVSLAIDDWQEHGEDVPLLVNCQPSGEYLGEEFYRAGGVPAVVGELLKAGLIDGSAPTVNGHSLAENCANRSSLASEVICNTEEPLMASAGFSVLSGNLCSSALMKKSVIGTEFRQRYLSNPEHPNVFRVRAIVFEGPEDYHARINDPALEIDQNCILAIRGCGPIGYPGSAEVVNMLPPDHMVAQGITGLPCLGDGRQSGTSASPSILNMSPEAAVGGGLAYLRTNDTVEVDLNSNTLNALVPDEEWQKRQGEWQAPVLNNQTPWQELYRAHVTQLEDGADLRLEKNYLAIDSAEGLPRHNH